MKRLSIAYLIAALMAAGAAARAHAAASDYKFEALTPEVTQSATTLLKVRLTGKDGKPVPGAKISRARLDMAPDGMAQHTGKVAAQETSDPGIYAFTADFSMAGRWQLNLAAKVSGEPETVTGKLIFKVNEGSASKDHSGHTHMQH